MKKLASVLLSALMAASLVACGTATDAGTPAEPAATEETTTAAAGEEGNRFACCNGDCQRGSSSTV